MSRRVLIHQQAKDDLIGHYAYVARDKTDPAERLLIAVRKLFDDLIKFPKLGRPWKTEAAHLMGIRVIPIPGFSNYLVFYRATARDISILTVIHGSRDLPALLRVIDHFPSAPRTL